MATLIITTRLQPIVVTVGLGRYLCIWQCIDECHQNRRHSHQKQLGSMGVNHETETAIHNYRIPHNHRLSDQHSHKAI